MGADVFVFDRSIDRLRELDAVFGGRGSTVYSSTLAIEELLPEADLVIGAVLVARRPRAARDPPRAARADEAARGAGRRLDRPGRLLRDLAPDDPPEPTYEVDGITHYCVDQHARRGAGHLDPRAHQRDAAVRARAGRPRRDRRARGRPGLRSGVNVAGGVPTHPAVAPQRRRRSAWRSKRRSPRLSN